MTGTARSQTLLLPPEIDDYVGPDNPVRFIDAFVGGLDLTGLKRLRLIGYISSGFKEVPTFGWVVEIADVI